MNWYLVSLSPVVAVTTWFVVRVWSRSPDTQHNRERCYFKWLIKYLYLKLTRKSTERFLLPRLDQHLFPTVFDEKLDKVQSLIDFRHPEAFDCSYFTGTDAIGNYILIRISRFVNRRSEVWLVVKTPTHGILTLPSHPDTNIYNVYDDQFCAGGLRCAVLEPMRRWRISFNGLLRKGVENDGQDSSDDDQMVHVRFTFIWTAITIPFDYMNDISLRLVAHNEDWVGERLRDKYEQGGQLYGTINVNGGDDLILHFRGLRSHTFGQFDWKEVNKLIDIHVYTRDGTLIHVGSAELINGCSRTKYGYLFGSNGAKFAITRTDLAPGQTVEEKIKCSFVADQLRNVTVEPNCHKIRLLNGEKSQFETEINVCEVIVDDKVGFGVLQITRRLADKNLSEIIEKASVPLLRPLDEAIANEEKHLVINYLSNSSASTKLVGGKGASVSLLQRLEDKENCFTVPPCIHVTSSAFAHHLENNPQIETLIRQLERVAWKKTEGNIRQITEKLISVIRDTSVSPELKESIQKELEKLFGVLWEISQFAVRSSAIGEDGEELSCAGQNDTYLGVSGLENVCNSVVKCWASQFSFTAVEYKRQHGQLLNPGMAVVIQEMISADVAGVLFTRNPDGGNPAQMVITANYGLGESVVSALAEPDTIILTKTYDNVLSIKEKLVGSKSVYTKITTDGNRTENVETEKEKTRQFSISDDLCLRLGRIGILIEKSFGSARDIEWSIVDSRIYLLQARPITFLDQYSEFELTHELDSPVKTDLEQATKANTGEVFPDAATPLSISTIIRSLDLCLQISLKRQIPTAVFNPYTQTTQVTAFNHLLLNCIDLLFRNSEGKHSDSIKALELSIFGHVLDNDAAYRIAGERYRNTTPSKLTFAISSIKLLVTSRLNLNKFAKFCSEKQICFDQPTAIELHSAITNVFPFIINVVDCHCKTSSASTIWNLIALMTLKGANNTDWSNLSSDIATLLAMCSNVESSQVPTAIKELAVSISQDEEKEKFCSEKDLQKAVDWLENNASKPGLMFVNFIKNHGHRGFKEIDLYSRPWRMDPRGLVQILQNMAQMPSSSDETSQPKTYNDVQETINKLKTPTKYTTRKIISWILPKYRASVGGREKSKSLLIKMIDQLRIGYRNLSEKMVNEGFLPDADLAFFLTHYEIGQLLKTRSARLIYKAQQRKRLHAKLEKLQFPEIMVGLPEPIKEYEEDYEMLTDSTTQISGTPVCHGIAKGTARVITRLEDAPSIRSNDILITYATDIGWSPFFPLLSGVVTEIGGIVSHGAVIAREYGLPCVVGAHHATRLFSSGDQVVIDGGKGLLQKIKN